MTNRHQVPTRGVVFGKSQGNYVIKPESRDGHILVVGGVGSGKSSCVAIPTIRAWQSQIFAIDIKGELSSYARKYRSNIKVFNPKDGDAYGYDPYAFLRVTSNPTQEARAIANTIIPLLAEVKDPFWIESAQTLLTGAILHYFALGYSFIETLKEVQKNGAKRLVDAVIGGTNETAQLYMGGFVDMADKTLSSIFAELSRNIISLVTDADIVSALSSRKVIEPVDLEYGYDIFLNIPEHLLRQWKNLLSLMVNQFLLFFERRDEAHTTEPILFLLDEFPRLGKIPFIMDALATLRSKRVSICMVLQSLAQLDMIYGENERKVIADTCAYKAVLSATDPETQDYFSKLVGTYEKEKKSKGINTDPFFGIGRSKNENTTTEEKRIIKPEEFATLGDIVLLHPFKPGFLRVDKVPYFMMND
ncbi:MAG: type IV secretory system conjugative DNA transfer family protein [Treponema sp.]|nr:type IV secretory system conjugative DNA transfer family protein [Treponema sp.]